MGPASLADPGEGPSGSQDCGPGGEVRSHQHNGDGFYHAHICWFVEKYADTSFYLSVKSILIDCLSERQSFAVFSCSHSLKECSTEKSSLCHLKSNNENCDNVMLGESVTLLFSPLGFWQKAKLVLTVGQRARRGGPFININILSFLLFGFSVYI